MWNTELISNITLGAAATVPIIVALTQMVKMTGAIPGRFIPFISIAIGVGISFLLSIEASDWSANILAGILFGLSASGLYSNVKASAHALKTHERKDIMRKNKL